MSASKFILVLQGGGERAELHHAPVQEQCLPAILWIVGVLSLSLRFAPENPDQKDSVISKDFVCVEMFIEPSRGFCLFSLRESHFSLHNQ